MKTPKELRSAPLAAGALETDAVEVRTLRSSDLDAIVRIDREWTGRARTEYYQLQLAQAERDTSVRVSLAAIVDGALVGFLLARVYYGEFGAPEPVAHLDTIAVRKSDTGRHVATALLRQLQMNLLGLRIERIQTQVDWSQLPLLEFFAHEGFRPAARFCLERAVERTAE